MNIKYETSFANIKALAETLCTLGEKTVSDENGLISVDKTLLAAQGNTLIHHLYELDKSVQEIFKQEEK